jgi:hypothetical protein
MPLESTTDNNRDETAKIRTKDVKDEKVIANF